MQKKATLQLYWHMVCVNNSESTGHVCMAALPSKGQCVMDMLLKSLSYSAPLGVKRHVGVRLI